MKQRHRFLCYLAVVSTLLGVSSLAAAQTITLSGIIRDFNDTHPDFESVIVVDPGIVLPDIGPDKKPVYAGLTGNPSTHGQVHFDQWYRDTPGINLSMSYSIILTETSTPGIYEYNNSSFFPIDDQLFGNQGRVHNYHFTYEIHTEFTYSGGENFTFTGDDDLWVFINGRLAIDLGGVHGAMSQSIDLDSHAAALGIVPGNDYDFDLFFAERHTGASNFRIQTSIDLCEAEQPELSLGGYQTVSHTPPFWTVQVEMRNTGPGGAYEVSAMMDSDIPWLVIPDPNCFYGYIPTGGVSWGGMDSYTFDLVNHPGGSFNVWFDVTYQDSCGAVHTLTLDPEFDPASEHTQDAKRYLLAQNSPNPFNPTTEISYELPEDGFVTLKIYDVSGKLVRTLVEGFRSGQPHVETWNGKDSLSRPVASGVYFYRLTAGNFVETRRMVLLR